MDFGASGSGVAREWEPYSFFQQLNGDVYEFEAYQYSFAGPLTMSKGCDEAIEVSRDDTPLRDYIYRGSNPAVATDATCYMDWIAEQYQLRLDYDYKFNASCFQSSGDKQDINQDVCWTANGDTCDFTQPGYESCRLYAEEGIAKNVFQCKDTKVSVVQSSLVVQFPLTLYFRVV